VFQERAPDGVRKTGAGPNLSGIVANRCQLGFALAKGFVRELVHVAEVTEYVDLIELGCVPQTRIKIPWRTSSLRSTVPSFVLFRTPADAYYSALFLSKDEGKHPHLLLQAGRIVAIYRCPTPRSTGLATNSGDRLLAKTKLTVPATGDSRYWPRPKDAHYDNRPGRILTPGWDSEALKRKDS